MPVEHMLDYSLAAIGSLLLLLFGLVGYVFRSLSADMNRLLMALTDRLDKHEDQLRNHDARLVRLETKSDVEGFCLLRGRGDLGAMPPQSKRERRP